MLGVEAPVCPEPWEEEPGSSTEWRAGTEGQAGTRPHWCGRSCHSVWTVFQKPGGFLGGSNTVPRVFINMGPVLVWGVGTGQDRVSSRGDTCGGPAERKRPRPAGV